MPSADKQSNNKQMVILSFHLYIESEPSQIILHTLLTKHNEGSLRKVYLRNEPYLWEGYSVALKPCHPACCGASGLWRLQINCNYFKSHYNLETRTFRCCPPGFIMGTEAHRVCPALQMWLAGLKRADEVQSYLKHNSHCVLGSIIRIQWIRQGFVL